MLRACWVTRSATGLAGIPAILRDDDSTSWRLRLPRCSRGDHDANGGELSVDPPVAPRRILFRQAHDERRGSLRDGAFGLRGLVDSPSPR